MPIFIYCSVPPLYGPDNNIISTSCTDRVNDTTQNCGGIPVLLEHKEVGRAVTLEKTVVDGVSMLKYEVDLAEPLSDTSLVTFADGYAGSVSGSMWVKGLYPKKIQLRTN